MLIAMGSSQLDTESIYDYRVFSGLQIALHGHRTPEVEIKESRDSVTLRKRDGITSFTDFGAKNA